MAGEKLTNPLLDCEINQAVGEKEYKPSKVKIEEIIAKQKSSIKQIADVAVYYRDLNNGPWFGINENDNFAPASLLKLPIMMAYFKDAQSNLNILEKKIAYVNDSNVASQLFIPQKHLEDNKSYTVEQLIDQMVVYSDNNALKLLVQNIDQTKIGNLQKDLGIEPSNYQNENYLSVKSYSTLLRVLFNASYLNREMSEKALGLMTESKFNRGLTAKLPKDIVVAHKFGERDLPGNIDQLHDCGIIYYPNHPYLLCIMTRGSNMEHLSQTIEQISAQIYSDLDARFHQK